jgi:hypothetical protein
MAVDYLIPTHRVTMMGTCLGGTEIWNTGFWLGTDTTAAGPPTQAEADAIKTAWNTFFVNGTSKIYSSYKCDGIKVAWVMEDGTSDASYTKYSYYTTAISGTSTDTLMMPPQISLAATLTSAKARGFGSKGRMYLPGVNAPILSTGKITTGTVAAIAGNLKTFFDAVNASASVPHNVILNATASTKAGSTHDAEIWEVTGVKVGDVYDTQRRRRNQLAESYSAVALA